MGQNRMTGLVCLTGPKTGYTIENGVQQFWKYSRAAKMRYPDWHPISAIKKGGDYKFANKRLGVNYQAVMPDCDPADIEIMERAFALHVRNTRDFRSKAKLKQLHQRGEAQNWASLWLDSQRDFNGDECVFFPGAIIHKRQTVKYNYRMISAARAMMMKIAGLPPSKNMHAAHKCGMGHMSCVNPRHLYWATPSENVTDAVLHNGKHSSIEDFTEEQIEAVRQTSGLVNVIAWETGVPARVVSQIKRGIV